MAHPHKQSEHISHARKVMDRVRNEQQKNVLLNEVARLACDRSTEAMAESRKQHDRALLIKSRSAKRKGN